MLGRLTTFDQMIFKGHLTMLYPKDAFGHWLNRRGILLKDFKSYVKGINEQIQQHAGQLAKDAKHFFQYLESSMTVKNGQNKGAQAP